MSKTPQSQPFPLNSIEEVEPKVSRFAGIPTPYDMKKTKLFGIPLQSALTGETLSDEAIQYYINAAISEIEHVLDLNITPVVYKEKHDYNQHDMAWNYNYLKLDHPNVLHVHSVELSFTNSTETPGFLSFPLEHVHLRPQEGVIQLVPAFGTSISGFLLSAFSGTQFHALRAMGVNNFPGAIRVEYTAGFAPDKIPYLMSQTIETIAAINLLSQIGHTLFPQNSVSIGIDGVSQSVGGAGNQYLAGRIAQLEKERDRQLDGLRGYYQRRLLIDYL